MSKIVSKDDALAAIELVQFAYFKKVLEREKKRRRPSGDSDNENMDQASSEHGDEERPSSSAASGGGTPSRRSKRLRKGKDDTDEEDFGLSDDEASATLAALRAESRQKRQAAGEVEEMEVDRPAPEISDARFALFRSRMSALFGMEREESIAEDKVMEWLTQEPQNFTEDEVRAGLKKMEDSEQIMLSGGFVFLI
jgi:DNA replication licensing factor MCM3